jgi:hypothetical protein
MKQSYMFWILFCIVPACTPKKHIKKVTFPRACIQHEADKNPTPPITVWIHGTRFIRRPLFYEFFNGTPSIRLATELDPDSNIYENVHTLNSVAPDLFPLETFYAFGWSGKLSMSIRRQAACHLYEELQRIVKEYKAKYQQDPTIRLITHSHGGTVALNLARIEREPTDEPFTIDELILLGCPVQRATKKFIENDIFKHTCALYSGLDMVQILAPQITYTFYKTKKGHIRSRFHWPPFSHRQFQNHPKLAQVKVKINGRALFHSEFTSNRFISILPHILHVLNSCHHHAQEYDTQLLCVYTRNEK